MEWPGRVNGGAEGDRTLDLRIANATLSQLSYRPTRRRFGRSAVKPDANSSIELPARKRLTRGRRLRLEQPTGAVVRPL